MGFVVVVVVVVVVSPSFSVPKSLMVLFLLPFEFRLACSAIGVA